MSEQDMKYTELYDYIYSDSDGIGARKSQMTVEESAAWKIIGKLGGRKGFDEWWSDIGGENRDEIFDELKTIVKEACDETTEGA